VALRDFALRGKFRAQRIRSENRGRRPRMVQKLMRLSLWQKAILAKALGVRHRVVLTTVSDTLDGVNGVK